MKDLPLPSSSSRIARRATRPVRRWGRRIAKSIRVPADLSPITQYDPARETDPRDVGLSPEAVSAVWSSVEGLYASGMHPAVIFCLRKAGKVILHRAIGHASGNGPSDPQGAPKVLARPETPVCLFSASKAVTAMMIHHLVEKGQVHLTDPVEHYIPEFGRKGKHRITIWQILAHQAGFPVIPGSGHPPDLLSDFAACTRLLCQAPPVSFPGHRTAYHAITGGFILGEIVRRVSGMDIRQYLAETVQKPMGMRFFNYGVDDGDMGLVAKNYDTGLPVVFPLSTYIHRILASTWSEAIEVTNTPEFLRAIVPAGNLVATADEACRFFQMLMNHGELDGVRVFDPLTVRRAVTPTGPGRIDRIILLPMRYSAGFMLGANPMGLYGPNTSHAFGHWGFVNIFCWADPDRDISVALLNTGKPFLGPHLWPHLKLLTAISKNLPQGEQSQAG
ncbi:MAG: serine hydrolase domain-containing protein [Pseudomonadota bacterium]